MGSLHVRVTLPPQGFLVRDLLLSGLYVLAREGSALDLVATEHYVAMEFPSEASLRHGIERLILFHRLRRCNAYFNVIIGRFRKNYKDNLKKVDPLFRYDNNEESLKADLSLIVNDISHRLLNFSCDDQYLMILGKCGEDGYVPLLFPESMESARWFGGWKGTGAKVQLDIDPVLSFIALIGLCNFIIAQVEDTFLLVPIDSTIRVPSLLNNPIHIPSKDQSLDVRVLQRLSQFGRLLMGSLLVRGSRLQKIVTLTFMGFRIEVIENIPSSALAKFMNFVSSLDNRAVVRLLGLANRSFIGELAREEFSGDGDRALSDVGYVVNVVAKSVFDSLNGHLGPEEAAYFIARESFMRIPYYVNIIDDVVVRDIRDSLRAQLLVGG